jgi:hypothetical protein
MINIILKTYTNLIFKDFKEAALSSLSILNINFSKFILEKTFKVIVEVLKVMVEVWTVMLKDGHGDGR